MRDHGAVGIGVVGRVAAALPGNGFWSFLAHQQSHIQWIGCTLHDLIQPSFSFLVGFYQVMDVWNRRTWAFALTVVGMNSIAAYLIAHLWVGFIEHALPRHFGRA